MGQNTPPVANTETTKATGPTMVKMPRAVHELHTGPKSEHVIEAGTLLTDEVLKEHKLDDKAVQRLTASGAADTVEVLKG